MRGMAVARLMAVMLGGLTGGADQVRADFRFDPGKPPATVAPSISPISGSPSLVDASDAMEAPATQVFKAARGFGADVPLGFAVRQIVPAGIAVRFGPGVDRSASVDWSGGQAWNRVLAAAVRPLGLRITTTANAVLVWR